MPDISPLLIAATLLTQFIIARHIGLRTLNSLREVIGVGATIICTLPMAAMLDWILLHTVLRPFDIVYLRLFTSVILTAAITPLIEVMLRSRFASWFPPAGSLLPLTTTTCCTLIAAQITRAPDAPLFSALFTAIGLSLGTLFLFIVQQALREHRSEKSPQLRQSISCDLLNAAFTVVALRAVLSIWQ